MIFLKSKNEYGFQGTELEFVETMNEYEINQSNLIIECMQMEHSALLNEGAIFNTLKKMVDGIFNFLKKLISKLKEWYGQVIKKVKELFGIEEKKENKLKVMGNDLLKFINKNSKVIQGAGTLLIGSMMAYSNFIEHCKDAAKKKEQEAQEDDAETSGDALKEIAAMLKAKFIDDPENHGIDVNDISDALKSAKDFHSWNRERLKVITKGISDYGNQISKLEDKIKQEEHASLAKLQNLDEDSDKAEIDAINAQYNAYRKTIIKEINVIKNKQNAAQLTIKEILKQNSAYNLFLKTVSNKMNTVEHK